MPDVPDRILALHRLDLAAAVQLADQMAQVPGQRRPPVTVIDPVLHTLAQTLGLAGVQLLGLPDCDITLGTSLRSQASGLALQAEVDEVLAPLVPEARGAGWTAHWLRMLYFGVYGFRNVGAALVPRLAGERVHLLMPQQPQRYGYHSFVPALTLSAVLREAGVPVQLYHNPQPDWDAPLLADPAAHDPAAAVDLLCHLPTCFYDQALFGAEVLASGRRALVLPSQVYDVALPGLPRTPLAPPELLQQRLDPAQQAALAAVLDRLGGLLSQRLAPLIGLHRPLQAQVQALVEACRLNALLFFGLEQRLGRRPPRSLLLSNHDTGQHGALLSFAQRHGAQLLMVPHSKIFNQPVSCRGLRPLCLTHALQGGDVVDMDGARLPTAVLDFAAELQVQPAAPGRLRTLGVVLNGLAATSMCIVDLDAYLGGLQRLQHWCASQGVALRLRCRPNESVAAMLTARLGLPAEVLALDQQGGIVDFARGCDLLLGYDQPTSGMMEVLQQGIPVLHTLCRRLSPEEWRILDPRVVPQLPLDEALPMLERFCTDTLALWQYRRRQFADLVAAGRDARPLRHWLV